MNGHKITLVRHGKPTVSLAEWISGRSLCDFIERYNQAGIDTASHPPQASQTAIQDADIVFTSDYRRTLDSAKLLKLTVDHSHPKFREVDCWVNFGWPVPTPAWIWLLLTRFLWPLNWIHPPESYAQAQQRAAQAALTLIEAAQVSNHVVLVGHGGMNTLISRELRALGWAGEKQPKLSHWAATTYIESKTESGGSRLV